MKKIILYTIITSTLSGFTCLALEKPMHENLYLRLDTGKSKARKLNNSDAYVNDKLNTSNVINLGVGKYLDNNLRTDLTLTFRDYKLNNTTENRTATQKIKSTSVMLNGYYDINYFNTVTPYLSTGVGIARNNSGKLEITESDMITTYNKKITNNFTWQVGAGAVIKINDLFNVDLSYKYIDLGEVKTTQGLSVLYGININDPQAAKAKLKAQEITAGLRFNF